MSKLLIPNFITIFRIALSLSLFCVNPLSIAFFIVYYMTGATDVLDGYFARKWHCESKIGACLDSIADVIFLLCAAVSLKNFFLFDLWILLWTGGIAIVKISIITATVFNNVSVETLHHAMNKACGAMIFVFVPFALKFNNSVVAAILCAVATIATVLDFLHFFKGRIINKNRGTCCNRNGRSQRGEICR